MKSCNMSSTLRRPQIARRAAPLISKLSASTQPARFPVMRWTTRRTREGEDAGVALLPRAARPLAIAASLCLAAALACLFVFNPAVSRLFPPCPLHFFTGFYCPGCGSLRAIHLLLHGHLAAAIKMNPILALAIPFLGALLLKRSWAYQTWTPWIVLIVLITYGILRNIPAWPFILLAPG